MGNFFAFSSTASLFVYSAEKLYTGIQQKNSKIELEELENIELKDSNLTFLPFGAHFFAVANTYSGRKVRFDYTADRGPSFVYDYYDLYPSEAHKIARAIPGTTVKKQ